MRDYLWGGECALPDHKEQSMCRKRLKLCSEDQLERQRRPAAHIAGRLAHIGVVVCDQVAHGAAVRPGERGANELTTLVSSAPPSHETE